MWELFQERLAKRGMQLDAAQMETLQGLLVYKKFRKHQYILQQGDICRNKTYIIKGLVRAYVVDEKGQEHILLFGSDDRWVEDLYSFNTGVASEVNIDCLEETEVLQLSKPNTEILFNKVPQFNTYFRLYLEESLITLSRRMAGNLSKTASERYYDWVQRFPDIKQRVPDHLIAAYLGITPQSLSRIRNQSGRSVKS